MFNVNDRLQGLRSTLISSVLLLAATVIGFVWISIGLYHWLTLCIGLVWGPIVLGLIYFLPIIIFAFIKAFTRTPVPELPAANERIDNSMLQMSGIFENLSGRPPFFVVSAAIIAGFLATRFPALLSVFTQLLTAYAEDAKTKAGKEPAYAPDASPKHE
ncbi:MAG: hypothetical protein EOO53_08040 [Gammaproteobacteria bacterium]|nr:MAG: hypothetical protein EOO53_08040 [Gammaproteobacteria bacterium]